MSGRCGGLHCSGCKDGGGAGLIALVVAVVIAGAVVHAIWRTLAEVAEIAAITVAGAAGLAVIAGAGWLVHQARQDRRRDVFPARPISQLPPGPRARLEGSDKPAIGPAREIHLHLAGLTPGQIAAIVTQRGAYPEEDR